MTTAEIILGIVLFAVAALLVIAGIRSFQNRGYLFNNATTRADIVRVMINTFAMSGLGLITQWIPMAFAIFLCEIKILSIDRCVFANYKFNTKFF